MKGLISHFFTFGENITAANRWLVQVGTWQLANSSGTSLHLLGTLISGIKPQTTRNKDAHVIFALRISNLKSYTMSRMNH